MDFISRNLAPTQNSLFLTERLQIKVTTFPEAYLQRLRDRFLIDWLPVRFCLPNRQNSATFGRMNLEALKQ